jgi:uncharacterized protein with HEPN domain
MPSETERAVLHDIVRHLDLVRQFTQGHDYESFHVDLPPLRTVVVMEIGRLPPED